jgi:hypothetical protein
LEEDFDEEGIFENIASENSGGSRQIQGLLRSDY